jgi:acyl dehydratase
MTNPPIAPLTLDDLKSLVGKEIGVSSWLIIDQSRIDAFAVCTGDQQWIHVDPERAAKEGPFGGTVAHGFLTLSLLAPAGFELLVSRLTLKQAVNAGLTHVRFLSPVRSGQNIRVRFNLESLEEKKPGTYLASCPVSVEIEGEEKPALVATSQFMMMF